MSPKANQADSQENTDSDGSDLEETVPVHEDQNVIHIGVIADKEVILGLLLAGVGYHREKFCNYLMVEPETPLPEIDSFFNELYKHPNIGLILLDYPTAKRMHNALDKCKRLLPVIIILPTKASIIAYMEEKDRMRRQRLRDVYA